METNLVVSLGSIVGLLSLGYLWHKDSKSSATEITELKGRIQRLEQRIDQHDQVLTALLESVQEIKITLATMAADIRSNKEGLEKIDTKITRLEQDFQEFRANNKSRAS
jgi:septal ring factor EnvC (AmiA/AmiB activator)